MKKLTDLDGQAGIIAPMPWLRPDAVTTWIAPLAAANAAPPPAMSDVLYLQEAGDSAPISVSDINQGQLGDCYLLSAIGELALTDPASITGMITANANGTETVTLYEDASGRLAGFGATSFKPVSVTVTNSFPSGSVDSGAGQDVAGNQKEIWVQVLEKAVATLGGGYGSIANGGNPMLAMETLTGQGATYVQPASVTAQLLQADASTGDLITFDTGAASGLPYGLFADHAYMFEDLTNVDGAPAVQLLNPWGFDEPAAIPLSRLSGSIVEVDIGHPASPIPPPAPMLVIGGVAATQSTTDEAALRPFARLTLTGVASNQTETAIVTASAASDGILGNPGAGSIDAASGVYTVTGTAAVVAASLDGLLFTPTAHQIAPRTSETTRLTVAIGGRTASTSIVTTAVDDAPRLSGTIASQATIDTAQLRPYAAVAIVEPDSGQTLTATVALSGAANGTLSMLGRGAYDQATGVYTVCGTAAAVDDDLRGLVFTPTPHQVAPGATVATILSMKLSDTAGAAASSSTAIIAKGTEDVIAAGASSMVTGMQKIATLLDDGSVCITGSLDITTVDPSSTGIFILQGQSALEISACVGAASQIRFLSGGGELMLDSASSFGARAGTPNSTGPVIGGFGTGDAIDLKGSAGAGITLAYAQATGLLQIQRGTATLATLSFQNATLGNGVFHAASDSHGGLLVTRS